MQWKGTLEGKAGDVASLEVNRSDTSDFTFHTFGLTLEADAVRRACLGRF